ncbi:hypothetical protein RYX36_013410, partial [Vicia faba]
MSDSSSKGDSVQIREVWNDNLEKEFALIREVVDDFNYVAMDTEFPGVVLRPIGVFKHITDYNYQTLKDNVDMLNLIQLGLTFSDENGNLPTCGTGNPCIWQFNFSEDIAGIDGEEIAGIDRDQFGTLLLSSGIVLNDNIKWITFYGGYGFGYLLKLLTCRALPDTQSGFFQLINLYFPMLYDIKHLMKFCNGIHGDLNKLAELLEVERLGVDHQAGSDSFLTAGAFRKLSDTIFNGETEKYSGVLYGLGSSGLIYGLLTSFVVNNRKGNKKPIRKVEHSKSFYWTTILKKDGKICEILSLLQTGTFEIRSLPDLELVTESSLLSILRWNYKVNMD